MNCAPWDASTPHAGALNCAPTFACECPALETWGVVTTSRSGSSTGRACGSGRRCLIFDLLCLRRRWTAHDPDSQQDGFSEGYSDYQRTRQPDAEQAVKRETAGT